MAITRAEIKRKLFHNLVIVYMLAYAFLPRWATLTILGTALVIVGIIEFIRLRRPEVNAWFLSKFSGIHRDSEVMKPSGIFWTLLGSWLTIFVFPERRIVLPALGFMAFGDTAAALGGQKWGKHPWPKNPRKTYEGSACFAAVSAVWALFFLRWPAAIPGAVAIAWLESLPLPYNDNLWLPVVGAFALSVLNLTLGKFG